MEGRRAGNVVVQHRHVRHRGVLQLDNDGRLDWGFTQIERRAGRRQAEGPPREKGVGVGSAACRHIAQLDLHACLGTVVGGDDGGPHLACALHGKRTALLQVGRRIQLDGQARGIQRELATRDEPAGLEPKCRAQVAVAVQSQAASGRQKAFEETIRGRSARKLDGPRERHCRILQAHASHPKRIEVEIGIELQVAGDRLGTRGQRTRGTVEVLRARRLSHRRPGA